MKALIKYLPVITAVALLSGCRATDQDSAAPATAASPANVAKLFADYYEERLRLYPTEATFAGDDRYNDQLPNNITEGFRALGGRQQVFLMLQSYEIV